MNGPTTLLMLLVVVVLLIMTIDVVNIKLDRRADRRAAERWKASRRHPASRQAGEPR